MPRTPLGWLLTIAVPTVAIVVAVAAAGGIDGGGLGMSDASEQATAVCDRAQAELRRLPGSPQGIAAALQTEHRLLAILDRELTDLEALAPKTNASFRAGLADDRSLLQKLKAMVDRPDFVHLSLTLPGHPELVPGWLKAWLSHEQALQRDASRKFSQGGIAACKSTLAT